MKRIALLMPLVCLVASGQNWMTPLPGGVRISSFSGLPVATSVPQTLSLITNSITSVPCATTSSMCYSNGTLWYQVATPAGGGGAGTVTHSVGALTSGQLIIGNAGADIKTGDLSGDVSTSGSAATTLATVNSNVGACGDATHTSQITLDAKGRATGCTPVLITASSGITALTGDVTATGPGSAAATLATVGSAGSCGDSTHSCQITFDTKGRETARANVAIAGAGSTATAIQTGAFASPPSAAGAAGIFYDTSGANNGLPFYYSTAAGTANYLQLLVAGPSGGITFGTGGATNAIDIDTNVVCRLTNSCPIAALWSFAIGQDFAEQASGSTPAAGKLHIYANTDHTFHQVTSGGVDTSLGGGGSVTPHWVAATNSGTQVIPGSLTLTDILFNTNDASTTNSALHNTVTNTQNFVADATGFWHGIAEVSTGSVATDIGVIIFVNGTAIWNGGAPGVASTGSGVWQVNVPWSAHLTSGDIVKCSVVSNAGFTAVSGAGTKFYMELQH